MGQSNPAKENTAYLSYTVCNWIFFPPFCSWHIEYSRRLDVVILWLMELHPAIQRPEAFPLGMCGCLCYCCHSYIIPSWMTSLANAIRLLSPYSGQRSANRQQNVECLRNRPIWVCHEFRNFHPLHHILSVFNPLTLLSALWFNSWECPEAEFTGYL